MLERQLMLMDTEAKIGNSRRCSPDRYHRRPRTPSWALRPWDPVIKQAFGWSSRFEEGRNQLVPQRWVKSEHLLGDR